MIRKNFENQLRNYFTEVKNKEKKILVRPFLSIKLDRFWNEVLKSVSDKSNDPVRVLRSAASGAGRYRVVSEQGDVPARLRIVYQSRDMILGRSLHAL